ncbi:asparagine synthase (glutamine-hydrolyzing) [Novispirillum itersonii]|uniref:asparagine synthase (glutamine-hydrolyzing) n=1 Tax=Novispirillum itersonii TaxID=189 RepID=UPI000377CDF1|nr:asparagine synthase (glutamine-hydrolyzing) [Novispirillum itersonii]
MCGIAGFFSTGAAAPGDAVLRMAQALAHRGPDGVHVHADGGPVALGHSRLAIIDLQTGDQPLFWDGGRVLVANGEIYNDPALRDDLTGQPFRTRSDCETPLVWYGQDGAAFPRRLRGMFGIALYDPADGVMVLTRDPFGIKPLYLAETPGGIAFASEAQALVAGGFVTPRLDPAKVTELLQLQFTTGDRLPLQGIQRLMPGETVVLKAGRIIERRRQSPLPDVITDIRDEETAVTLLDAALENSVLAHQRSDVPYGMFLSGGIDSSAVLALMARLNPQPVVAFTAGFPETAVHDERDHARALARQVGAEHHEVAVTAADFWQHLPRMVESMDDPVADYAIVPTWLLAREARKQVRVILSGEGGDELFAGYGRYRSFCRPWPFARPMRRSGTFDGLGVLRDTGTGWRDGMAAAERAATARFSDRLTRAQAIDIADWLPNDLLLKADRCLMAHGVEGRVPFLDPVVADVALRLHPSLRLRGKTGKYILRRWLDRVLPQARPFAPKKGFTVPVGEWIAADGARVGALVAASPGVAEIADPDAVRALFTASGKQQRFAAWSLLFYALWHRRHVAGQGMDGTTLDVLAAR